MKKKNRQRLHERLNSADSDSLKVRSPGSAVLASASPDKLLRLDQQLAKASS